MTGADEVEGTSHRARGRRHQNGNCRQIRRHGGDRLAAGARSRGTVALELAPGRRGPLDDSEADRRRPTRMVQVDWDSTSKSYSNDFRHDRPTQTPTDSWLHRRCDRHKAPLSPQSDGEAVPGPQQLAENRGDTAGNLTRTLGMR